MADRTAHRPLRPFTVDHFRAWARLLVLDNGKPWIVEDFQLEPVADLFAGVTEVWMLVPEGNTKTTLMAGVGLYYGDYRPDAMVLLAASSRDQAGWLLKQGIGFVKRSPGASKRYRPLPGYRHIRCLRSGGVIQVFAADERTGDGPIYDLALLDELHRHRGLGLLRTWRGKADKRGGQLGVISTAGEPDSEFEQTVAVLRERGTPTVTDDGHERIVAGDAILHRWAVPEHGDFEDLEQVKAANPFSGVTIESLGRKRSAPSMTEAHWRRLTCNQAVRGDSAAIDAMEWQRAGTTDRIPEGEPIAAGLDVAWKWDTTALVPFWMPEPTYRLLGVAEILVPPRDGRMLDPHKIERALLKVHERNPLHTVVMDRERAEQLATWIEEELGATVAMYGHTNQPASLAYERFMDALRQGWLRHSQDPALTSHVLNAITRLLPGDRVRFDRPTRTRQGGHQDGRVIDGLDAAASVNAVMGAPVSAPMSIDLEDYRIGVL